MTHLGRAEIFALPSLQAAPKIPPNCTCPISTFVVTVSATHYKTPLLHHSILYPSHPMENIEDRLAKLGITLPPLPQPMANYVPFTLAGNLLYVSGQGPKIKEGEWVRGQVGKDLTVEQGYDAARLVGIQLLAVINGALGSLDRVKRILKVNGFVNSGPGFGDQPAVINGCSDLFVELLGDAGRHARTSIGVSNLPQGIAVEIEAIAEVLPG
jgi:enamine deaminase RidA (YjgF/YER057c/UK114 family)